MFPTSVDRVFSKHAKRPSVNLHCVLTYFSKCKTTQLQFRTLNQVKDTMVEKVPFSCRRILEFFAVCISRSVRDEQRFCDGTSSPRTRLQPATTCWPALISLSARNYVCCQQIDVLSDVTQKRSILHGPGLDVSQIKNFQSVASWSTRD